MSRALALAELSAARADHARLVERARRAGDLRAIKVAQARHSGLSLGEIAKVLGCARKVAFALGQRGDTLLASGVSPTPPSRPGPVPAPGLTRRVRRRKFAQVTRKVEGRSVARRGQTETVAPAAAQAPVAKTDIPGDIGRKGSPVGPRALGKPAPNLVSDRLEPRESLPPVCIRAGCELTADPDSRFCSGHRWS